MEAKRSAPPQSRPNKRRSVILLWVALGCQIPVALAQANLPVSFHVQRSDTATKQSPLLVSGTPFDAWSSSADSHVGSLDANAAKDSDPIVTLQTPNKHQKRDINANYFYKNKLEISLEGGWMPINVPFMFDFLVGDAYITEFMQYTMVPIFASLDWQMSKVSGPLFLRGSWDATFGGTAASVSRGPESRYFGYVMGLRRNFIQRRWRVVPYLDGRVGAGHIDARGPQGVWGAQGQDLVFTLNISSGVRYQLTPRYAISGGVGYMHISNMYLSLPRYANNGINVVGLMVGVHMRFPTREERTQ